MRSNFESPKDTAQRSFYEFSANLPTRSGARSTARHYSVLYTWILKGNPRAALSTEWQKSSASMFILSTKGVELAGLCLKEPKMFAEARATGGFGFTALTKTSRESF